MSRLEPESLGCPCGHEFTVQAADSLHVTDQPELRQAVLGGTFHVFPCPRCGARVRLEKLLPYTDFHAWHWFAVFPDRARDRWAEAVARTQESFAQTLEQKSPPVVAGEWAPRFKKSMRTIFGLDSLRDKLSIFDANLDDRILELLKLEIVRWYDLPWQPESRLWFDRVDQDQRLVFAWIPSIGPDAPPARPISVPMDMYQRAVLDPAIRTRVPALFDSVAVDMRLLVNRPEGRLSDPAP